MLHKCPCCDCFLSELNKKKIQSPTAIHFSETSGWPPHRSFGFPKTRHSADTFQIFRRHIPLSLNCMNQMSAHDPWLRAHRGHATGDAVGIFRSHRQVQSMFRQKTSAVSRSRSRHGSPERKACMWNCKCLTFWCDTCMFWKLTISSLHFATAFCISRGWSATDSRYNHAGAV